MFQFCLLWVNSSPVLLFSRLSVARRLAAGERAMFIFFLIQHAYSNVQQQLTADVCAINEIATGRKEDNSELRQFLCRQLRRKHTEHTDAKMLEKACQEVFDSTVNSISHFIKLQRKFELTDTMKQFVLALLKLSWEMHLTTPALFLQCGQISLSDCVFSSCKLALRPATKDLLKEHQSNSCVLLIPALIHNGKYVHKGTMCECTVVDE
jgi:hypothetical protein